MSSSRGSWLVIVLAGALLTPPTAASAVNKKVKRQGGYEVTVTGTATRDVEAQDREQCGADEDVPGGYEGSGINLVSGSFRATMKRTRTIPRVSFSGAPFMPWGAVRGYTLQHTTEETYDDLRGCAGGGLITETCSTSRPEVLGAGQRLVIAGDGPRHVLIALKGGDPPGFASRWLVCAPFAPGPFHVDVPERIRFSGLPLYKRVRLLRFTEQRTGKVTISASRPETFRVPSDGAGDQRYRGSSAAELTVKWRRVRRTPPFRARL